MKSTLIVGYGIVGYNLYIELNRLCPHIYDKYKKIKNTKQLNKYDFAFICVDTPATEQSNCDITEVRNAIIENEADIYIIKSAVLPGTQEKLSKELNKHIVISPEYYGGTQHCNNYNFDFTILGGEKEDCKKVVQLLQNVYDGRHTFRIVDARTAELVKYMENSYIATKVTFCTQFYEIAKSLRVDYEELRELFILDPRVNPSHTFVYDDHPYWDSHCLNKDVPAIAELGQSEFLKSVVEINNKQKQK